MWRDRGAIAGQWLENVVRAVVPPRLVRRYRERESFRRRVRRALAWGAVLAVLYPFLFTDSGVVSLLYRQVRIRALQHQVAGLERRQEWLEREARLREKDPETIERLARERCGMAYPGEKVYRIVEISPAEARRIEREKRAIEKQREREEPERATQAPSDAARH